jgi:tRNA(fMet)-specific endonuclease VapC
VILDTSIFIEAERGRFDLAGLLESVGEEPVAIAAVTASELLHGVERANDDEVRFKRHQFVERIVADFPVLPFDLSAARIHARLWAALAARGVLIGPHDLLVAATAIASGSAVASLNQKEFKRIPDLALVPITAFARLRRP